jgi:D-tyrosyl-tRNA(Tyr) deacylase
MRALLQRVSRAAVRVDGAVVGSIDHGLLVLVGFTASDAGDASTWMADKVCDLRVFADGEGKMNRSVVEAGGGVLVVSQFTLYGDAQTGRRPSFTAAARPAHAQPLYERFVDRVRERGVPVATGRFGAMMEVELVNDGPVTLWLER